MYLSSHLLSKGTRQKYPTSLGLKLSAKMVQVFFTTSSCQMDKGQNKKMTVAPTTHIWCPGMRQGWPDQLLCTSNLIVFVASVSSIRTKISSGGLGLPLNRDVIWTPWCWQRTKWLWVWKLNCTMSTNLLILISNFKLGSLIQRTIDPRCYCVCWLFTN